MALELALIIVGCLIAACGTASLFISGWLGVKYYRYNRTQNSAGMTGQQIARKILDDNGLYHIQVKATGSIMFGNSYSHYFKKVRLRRFTRHQTSLTSLGMGAQKAALAILSAGGPQNFTLAVMTGDEKLLTAAQGVGKKIAQRIILELKDKIGGSAMELDFSGVKTAAAPVTTNHTALASAALQELGYSAAEVAAALKGVDPKATTEEMVRYGLRQMVMKG